MQFRIEGTPLPVVTCDLTRGEAIVTESGGMCWMSDGISMETNMNGGLAKGIGRMFSGESMFLATYTCQSNSGYIAFSSSFPGDILAYDVGRSGPLIVQKTSFLASESSVQVEVHFKKRLGAGLFGGEGFIMQRVFGSGIVFLEIDGATIRKDLSAGEILRVDTGHVAAYTEGMGFEIEQIRGVKNVLFGGEGLFNTVLRGPGTVFLQTMPAINVAKSIIPYIPSKS